MQIKLEIRRDLKTAFPAVRLWQRVGPAEPYACVMPGESFVSLLPVTKIQVEQFIWDHGFPARELAWFTERLNLGSNRIRDRYPTEVSKLQRRALAALRNSDELCALLATNLTVWRTAQELKDGPGEKHFPTEESEWGQVLKFIGGRAPTDIEWLQLHDGVSRIPTRLLLEKALELYPHSNDRAHVETRTVRRLLQHLKQFADEGWEGLPFLNFGGYELLSNPGRVKRLAADPDHGITPGFEVRAQVAGDSMLWPALDGISEGRFRLLLKRNLPVVTVRPVFNGVSLRPEAAIAEFELDTLLGAEQVADTPPIRDGAPGAGRRFFGGLLARDRGGIARLPEYMPSVAVLKGVCPHCMEEVPDAIYNTKGVFYCWRELQKREEAGVSSTVFVRRHTEQRPSVHADVVPRKYLDLASSRSGNRVRLVALNGFSKAGKTTWLISLAGLMDYPNGKSRLFLVFPEALRLRFSNCAVRDWGREADRRDPKLPTERMWLDGLLPPRNSAENEAARMPVHFVEGGNEDSLILDFSDIAGELLFGNLSDNPNFRHVPSTMDVIFFMPARDPDNEVLNQFLAKMQVAVRNGKALKLRELNLILAFTKIDELKYGTEDDRELLHRMLPTPYRYPESSKEGLQKYLDQMYDVHVALREWVHQNKPQMLVAEQEFASVRYCGLSSFGFAPMVESEEADFDQSIPFPPQPVRAIDPLLWLLHGNGLLRL